MAKEDKQDKVTLAAAHKRLFMVWNSNYIENGVYRKRQIR